MYILQLISFATRGGHKEELGSLRLAKEDKRTLAMGTGHAQDQPAFQAQGKQVVAEQDPQILDRTPSAVQQRLIVQPNATESLAGIIAAELAEKRHKAT